ncbi:MAG: acyltransferase family protein [Thermoanaerobaculia bacterium]
MKVTEPRTSSAGKSAYRPDIDGLRAIAVLAVLAFHAFPDRLPGGFVGVDVFFVISGFLISGILLAGLDQEEFSLRRFYAHRVRRIFPALLVILAACGIFGWFALFPDEFQQLGKHIAGGAAFSSNLTLWHETGYFDNAAETKPLLHLWSLGIEEQFYIVWPLLLWGAHRLRWRVLTWMPLLAAISFLINVVGLDRYPTATFYSPASRAWELALGGILAGLASKGLALFRGPGPQSPGSPLRHSLFSTAGLALLLLSLVRIDEGTPFPGWWALAPAIGTALILGAGAQAWPNRWLLSSRPMVWIGLISYPLYLWHWPLLAFARIVESETPALAIRVWVLALSFPLAALTYLWVERPIRFGGGLRGKAIALSGAMVAVALAGLFVARNQGLPSRSTVQTQLTQQAALVLRDESNLSNPCKARYGFDETWEVCMLDDVDAAPTVALLGDSHGHHLVAGLTEHYRSHGDNLLYLGTRLPFWDVPARRNDDVQKITNQMLDLALQTPSIQTVVISTRAKLHNSSPDGRQVSEALRATVERFVAAGKQVVIVRDIPRLDFQPRQCIRRVAIPASTTKSPCAMSREIFELATAQHDALLGSVLRRFPTVELFDAPSYLCDEALCWAMRDGVLLYRDPDHLSTDGSLYLGRRFGLGLLSGASLSRWAEEADRRATAVGEVPERPQERRRRHQRNRRQGERPQPATAPPDGG